jgi:zinc transporter
MSAPVGPGEREGSNGVAHPGRPSPEEAMRRLASRAIAADPELAGERAVDDQPGQRSERPAVASVLDGGGGARRITLGEARDHDPDQGPLWVHLDYRHAESRAWLTEVEALSPADAAALLRPVTQTRVEALDDERLLLALLVVPGGGPGPLRSFRAVLAPGRMVTLFGGRLPAVESTLSALAGGHGPRSVAEILTAIVEHTCAQIELTRLHLGHELADLEWLAEGPARPALERLHQISRETAQARRGLARQRAALTQIAAAAAPWLIEERTEQWRELANRTDDLVSAFEDIADGLRTLSEQLQARLATTLDARLAVLTAVAAIALPMLVVITLLTVNIGGLPARQSPAAFATLCAGLAVLGAAQLWVARRRRWRRRRRQARASADY